MTWRAMVRTFDSRVGGCGEGVKASIVWTLVLGPGGVVKVWTREIGYGMLGELGRAGEDKIIDELEVRGGG